VLKSCVQYPGPLLP